MSSPLVDKAALEAALVRAKDQRGLTAAEVARLVATSTGGKFDGARLSRLRKGRSRKLSSTKLDALAGVLEVTPESLRVDPEADTEPQPNKPPVRIEGPRTAALARRAARRLPRRNLVVSGVRGGHLEDVVAAAIEALPESWSSKTVRLAGCTKEGAVTAAFAEALADELLEEFGEGIDEGLGHGMFDRLKDLGDANARRRDQLAGRLHDGDWRSQLESLFRAITLLPGPRLLVVRDLLKTVDQLRGRASNRQTANRRVASFVTAFEGCMEQAAASSEVRFLVVAEPGLRGALRQCSLPSAFDDFEQVVVGAESLFDARQRVARLLSPDDAIDPAMIDALFDASGGHAADLEVLVDELLDVQVDHESLDLDALVERALQQGAASHAGEVQAVARAVRRGAWWGAARQAANAVLRHVRVRGEISANGVADATRGIPSTPLVGEIMQGLVDAGALIAVEDRWRFRSELLRRAWPKTDEV